MKIFLTGRPGIGKTTLIRRVLSSFKGKAEGFITEEIREKGERVGFLVRDLEGKQALMAHVNFKEMPRVGRYGIWVSEFERVAIPALLKAKNEADLIVVDEIGKMEILSSSFREIIWEILHSPKALLGTISLAQDPFLEKIRRSKNLEIMEVTLENRDSLLSLILQRFQSAHGSLL